jgi:DNA polymerase I-like protein with 3'-5' exonuclease and polymerase domains
MLYIVTSANSGNVHKAVKPKLPRTHKYLFKKELPQKDILEDGDLILVLGAKCLKEVSDLGLVPKNRTVSSLRQKPINDYPVPMLVSHDPYTCIQDTKFDLELHLDINLAYRLMTTGTHLPVLGNYRWVKDFTDALNWVEEHQSTILSVDLETVGLDPWAEDKFIVSISITYKKGMADLIRFQGHHDQPEKGSLIWTQINTLLNHPKATTRGANFKFDLVWMAVRWGIRCGNFKFDTTIVGSLLNENISNSLNTHAKMYTELGGYDDELNSKHDKSRMDLIPDQDLLPYAGGDTDAVYQVSEVQKAMLLKDKRLARFYVKLLHPASRALEQMEINGVLVDVPYMHSLKEELKEHLKLVESKALKKIPNRIKILWEDKGISLTKSGIIKEYMFGAKGLGLTPLIVTEKTGQPSTAKNHLQQFQNHPEAKEFLELYFDYTATQKTLSTYVVGFMKHLRSDGYYHPTGILYKGDYGDGGDSGTVTGRLAFKNPAFQTVPKHSFWAKKLRNSMPAPEGYVWVQWDYSQGELRVAAVLANETNMIKAYQEGLDLHLATGAMLNGYTIEQALEMMKSPDPEVRALIKKLRQGGKAGNFGLIYGMSAGGYREYAKATYWVELSKQESEDQREIFFNKYPALTTWHETYKASAKAHGYIRSPLGRIRHLPNINHRDSALRSQAERQSINSPVQSCLSDMNIWALSILNDKANKAGDDSIIPNATIHDAVCAYVRVDKLEYWAKEMKHIMENLPLKEVFGWDSPVKFVADVEVGYRLGELVEISDDSQYSEFK